jgi:predicted PurR-regulated permease PerM
VNGTILRRTLIVVVAVIVIVAAVVFAAHIPKTISIFLIAAFIAFGAHPLVKRLEGRMPRPAAIAVVYVGLLSVLVVLALVIVPVAYGQIVVLIGHAPEYVAASQGVVANAEHTVRHLIGDRIPLPSYMNMQAEVGVRVSSFVTGAVAELGTIVVGAFTAMIVGISALILSVFFLLQGGEVRDGVLAFVPPSRRPGVTTLLRELVEVFGHFVSGQALLCAIVGAATWVLLFPAHFSFALLVAVVCALGYAVPFVGMLVAQIIAALLAIPQGSGMVLYVTVVIFVVGRVADNVLVPRIMAQSVGVSPITVMFAVFAGGELFGLPGLVLGIPAAALLKVLFGYFVQPYVVRMQSRGLAAEGTPGVHVDVSVEEAGAAKQPEAVVVSVTP